MVAQEKKKQIYHVFETIIFFIAALTRFHADVTLGDFLAFWAISMAFPFWVLYKST